MIIVTGGTGFVGSAVVWGLNERGKEDILVVDRLDHDEKEHNMASLKYEQLIDSDEFREKLEAGFYDDKGVEAIIHLGAITSTTADDKEEIMDVNEDWSKEIIRWCVDRGVRCVYISSAATYGDGGEGYSDDHELFDKLKPLNLYGQSKLNVDIWARDAGYLDEVAGLRYFNVFGPNEYHKEEMRSVLAKKFDEVKDEGVIRLFKSYNPDYPDGGQMRDFVYVKDVVDATLFFMDEKLANGVFNIGTGKARTWNDLAEAMFKAMDKELNIEYVEMPDKLKDQYQYYTQADISKLRVAGFKKDMLSLEDSVKDYVQNYLEGDLHLVSN
jgi:ADP-L-glycero-D-manno-heptose 6-epimerase